MVNEITVKVPDIGNASKVDVIEVLVNPGENIELDSPLITLESDKASMEIPSSSAGKIKEIKVKVGDKVSAGDTILILSSEEVGETKVVVEENEKPKANVEKPLESKVEPIPVTEEELKPVAKSETLSTNFEAFSDSEIIFAGPAVRRLAREFGVDLKQVAGSGRKQRITKEDLQSFVKARLAATNSGFNPDPAFTIDFSIFGEVETKPLNKIKRLTGINMHRSWITIPHVTQFDEADITDLEAFRQTEMEDKTKSYKLTILAFVTKVVARALKEFPQFNSSLDPSNSNLIYKKYFNIGIAVETPNGLVVPVIKGVDSLTVKDIAMEMARLSKLAREKGLMPKDMSGGCFTISSLGGIGGTAFTPIVNSPEVAILGLSRSSLKPVYNGSNFEPCLTLPLSLSYDHRVIDGAEAARFTRFIADMLADIRKIIL